MGLENTSQANKKLWVRSCQLGRWDFVVKYKVPEPCSNKRTGGKALRTSGDVMMRGLVRGVQYSSEQLAGKAAASSTSWSGHCFPEKDGWDNTHRYHGRKASGFACVGFFSMQGFLALRNGWSWSETYPKWSEDSFVKWPADVCCNMEQFSTEQSASQEAP